MNSFSLGGCCHCGCCIPAFDYLHQPNPADVPQRFSVNTGSWSWNLTTGITEATVSGPISPAVETTTTSQQWKQQAIVHPLDNVGQNQTAWIYWNQKYSAAFGSYLSGSAFYTLLGYNWIATDETSLVQHFHPCVSTGDSATLVSDIVPLIDTSANGSAAAPWIKYDESAIATLDASYPDDGHGGPVGGWWSLAVRLGNTVQISIARNSNGLCYWQAAVILRPRFSLWSNAVQNASPYVGVSCSGGNLSRYAGCFGFVSAGAPFSSHPSAGAGISGYFDAKWGRGWAVPPATIAAFNLKRQIDQPTFDDSLTWRNGGLYSIVGSSPESTAFKPFRSFVYVGYLSDNPINCTADITDATDIPMHLATGSTELAAISSYFGLTPPSTMTIKRLSDLT